MNMGKISAKYGALLALVALLCTAISSGIYFLTKGKIDEAIKEYNNAIDYGFSFTDDFGVNHFYHSIERLIILYRKRKDYDNELRIIDLALSDELTENDRKNLLHRKARTLSLINKLEL